MQGSSSARDFQRFNWPSISTPATQKDAICRAEVYGHRLDMALRNAMRTRLAEVRRDEMNRRARASKRHASGCLICSLAFQILLSSNLLILYILLLSPQKLLSPVPFTVFACSTVTILLLRTLSNLNCRIPTSHTTLSFLTKTRHIPNLFPIPALLSPLSQSISFSYQTMVCT
jgi:hypothetical protein